jgi:myo-inositol 2-dehydrogenase / D-chiro-inositol 1-dehydrogenase
VLVEVEAFAQAQYGYEVACRVTGSQGQAVMGDGSFVTRSKAFGRTVEVPELWLGRFAEAYRVQLQAWVDALRGGGPLPGASVWDGYAAAVVAGCAIEAYRSGQRVDVVLPSKPALYEPALYEPEQYEPAL